MIWLKHKIGLLPAPLRWLGTVLLASSPVFTAPIQAQVLRVGPFDFFAVGRLDAVYTTNIDRERKSEAEAEMEDYYLIAGIALKSVADVSYSTQLSIDTGVAIEKHFVREDLDNSTAPFGRLLVNSKTELRHIDLEGSYSWERSSDSMDNVALPSGRSSKTRNPQTRMSYGADIIVTPDPFKAFGSYEFSSLRHDKERFKDADEDRTAYRWGLGWQIAENAGIRYENERTLTERVSVPDDDPEWTQTERVMVDWRLRFLQKPEIIYSVGLEKEDTDQRKGEWELRHELTVRDEIEFNSRMRLSFQAAYGYEDNPEKDDISFVYGANFTHDISYSARQSLSANREPRRTLGSSTDTDTTSFRYDFGKSDLFLADLNFNFGVGYEISRPLDAPEEKVLSYTVRLFHEVAYSRRLIRTAAYDFTLENSNLIEEDLVEHRFTWSYEYTF